MSIKCDQYNQVCVVSVDGDLIGSSTESLRDTVEQRIDQQAVCDFVIDLHSSGFIDSRGLETLLWLKRRSEENMGRVVLAGVGKNCRTILEMTRLQGRFQCQDDVQAALRSMR